MSLEDLAGWTRSLWLVWLMALFFGIAFWAFRPRNRRRFEEDARIPFKDDDRGV